MLYEGKALSRQLSYSAVVGFVPFHHHLVFPDHHPCTYKYTQRRNDREDLVRQLVLPN